MSIDPRIKHYFRINSAAIPLRSIAIADARTHIDVINMKIDAINLPVDHANRKVDHTNTDATWLTPTSVGAVINEKVIGGAAQKILVF